MRRRGPGVLVGQAAIGIISLWRAELHRLYDVTHSFSLPPSLPLDASVPSSTKEYPSSLVSQLTVAPTEVISPIFTLLITGAVVSWERPPPPPPE